MTLKKLLLVAIVAGATALPMAQTQASWWPGDWFDDWGDDWGDDWDDGPGWSWAIRATATDTPGMAILAMVTRVTATDTLHMAILAMATRVTGAVTPMVVILLIRVIPVLAIQVVGGTPAMEGDGRAHPVAELYPGLPVGRLSDGWAVCVVI